jgi:hypothetical protein
MIRNKELTMIDFQCVTVDQVTKSYRGAKGHCRCGCKGTYRYTKRGAEEANPGYDVSGSISKTAPKRALEELQFQHGLFPVFIEGDIFNETFADCQIGNRDLTVYFKEA